MEKVLRVEDGKYVGIDVIDADKCIMSDGKSVEETVDGINSDLTELKWTKVWENPSLSSQFAAQTISLDLSAYSFILVEGYDSPISNPIIRVGGASNRLTGIGVAAGGWGVNWRAVTATNTGVIFSAGNFAKNNDTSVSTRNDVCIPWHIYGIK